MFSIHQNPARHRWKSSNGRERRSFRGPGQTRPAVLRRRTAPIGGCDSAHNSGRIRREELLGYLAARQAERDPTALPGGCAVPNAVQQRNCTRKVGPMREASDPALAMKPNSHNERDHRNQLRKAKPFLKGSRDDGESARERNHDGHCRCFRGRERAETVPAERQAPGTGSPRSQWYAHSYIPNITKSLCLYYKGATPKCHRKGSFAEVRNRESIDIPCARSQ